MKEMTKALIKFHSEVGKVAKNSTNPYFKSKYGDLNAYLDVIKEPLSNCGLALVQMPITNGLKTILMHESGETIESEMTIPDLPSDPQKVGAALTYMRRYMIAAFLSLNAEDDDGNSVSQAKTKVSSEMATIKERVKSLYAQVKAPTDKMCAFMANIEGHTMPEINGFISALNKAIKEQSK